MHSFEIISLSLVTIYIAVFSLLSYGFVLKETKEVKTNLIPITVIIPLRNEEKNITNLIQSFTKLNYNLNIVEFIFVDDHSTDNSFELLSNELNKTALLYKIIKQTNSKTGKKQAIEVAIKNTKNDYIITTDADSTPVKNWLKEYSSAFQNGNQFIIGPVINSHSLHLIGKLHNIEALMLSEVSMGSASLEIPLICSGANLGYSKSLFEDINPYQDNKTIASGDDVFFLEKVLLSKIKVNYLKTKNALVYTQAHDSYKALLSQAIRWNSKNKQLTQKLNFWFSILIFIVNLMILPNLLFGLQGNSFSILFLLLKFLIDFLFFYISALFYKQLRLILFTPFIYFFYPIHLLIIFVSSMFISVQWKERTIIKK